MNNAKNNDPVHEQIISKVKLAPTHNPMMEHIF